QPEGWKLSRLPPGRAGRLDPAVAPPRGALRRLTALPCVTRRATSPLPRPSARGGPPPRRSPVTEPSAGTHDSPVPGVHELLLELTGRLDDDLLAWARELVAVGEEGQAVELAVAALVAEHVTLTPAVRTLVVTASHMAHTDLDAEAALAPAVADGATGHRFDAAAGSGDRVAAVLAALPARRL